MKGKWKKRGLIIASAMLAGVLVSLSALSVSAGLNQPVFQQVYADEENTVSFESDVVEANESNVVIAKIVARGTPNTQVTVTYRTYNGNAIKNVDYQEVSNSVTLTIGSDGKATYPVSVKCLNDASSRETLRLSVTDRRSGGTGNTTQYGRYFNLEIVAISNPALSIGRKVCKCYLPYAYKVGASYTANESVIGDRVVAYLDDYKNMERRYHAGENDISGKEHWKTWKKGVNFDCETTRRWVNAYINNGLADAYGTYILKSIDDDKLHSSSNIYLSSGNREFMEKYNKSSSTPGLTLYYEIEPCTKGGHRLDGRAMYYIAYGTNPNKKDGDLVDLEELHVVRNPKYITWIQEENAWYSSKNTLYSSMFYKTEPYNGILDYGLAIFNNNKSWDREVHNIWMMLTLVDEKAPEIVGEYCQMNPATGGLDIYIRFDEPVYSTKKDTLWVSLNGLNTRYEAEFVPSSNYSDTLVYEIPASVVKQYFTFQIKSLTYQLPSKDISDLSYRVNQYKEIENNLLVTETKDEKTGESTPIIRGGAGMPEIVIDGGMIDLVRPYITATPGSEAGVPTTTSAVWDVTINANPSPEKVFENGNIYYSWTKLATLAGDKEDPSSYDYTHTMAPEEKGSFNTTLMKNEAAGIDSGDYYLHMLAVSSYGFTDYKRYGPYRLDGDAPELTNLAPDPNELATKTYRLNIKDKGATGSGTDIKYLALTVRYLDKDGETKIARFPMVDNTEITNTAFVSKTPYEGYTQYTYKSDISAGAEHPDEFISGLMDGRNRLDVEVYFEILDTAGNRSTSSSISTVYDTRDGFDVTVTKGDHYTVKDDSDKGIVVNGTVYDISAATTGEGLIYELPAGDTDNRDLIVKGAKLSVTVTQYNTKDGKTKETVFQSEASDACKVILKDLGPGYYEAIAQITGTVTISEVETAVNKVSKSSTFYLTKGLGETTVNKENANGNLVLTNRVYQLTDAAYYYFNASNSTVASFLYGATYNEDNGRYEGGSSNPTFSSSDEAKRYIRFMEYQGLELVKIDANTANLLNTGTGTIYVKATGETRNAAAGQLWIRYKKANWTPTAGPSGWAYYYYGEGNVEDGIVISGVGGLSANLNAAITAVTNRIVSEGSLIYLVGEEYTDPKTQAPYLSESQIHASEEIATKTMAGNTFVTNPSYAGDTALYGNNTVKLEPSGPEYLLATNLPLVVEESTFLYFRDANSQTGSWTLIAAKDGTLLKDALSEQDSGVYTIREYGKAGVSEFSVYIDKTLPKLPVTITLNGTNTPLVLDGNAVQPCQQMVLGKLAEDAEGTDFNIIDKESYVAVYTYPGRKLIGVFYGAEMDGYVLSGSNYYLVVGDRSGNVADYVVRTGSSNIEASISENEAGTLVYVRVTNREASEIYLYEVYLNEVLIDNVFDNVKTYRGAGVYRVEIQDIYGYTPAQALVWEHEAPTPEITWYYLNDNGGYSVYNEEKPGRMILKTDITASRTTNVYASTKVRLVFAGVSDGSADVEFEILGIDPSEYTYNSVTGSLSINSLSGWRLRVWYKNQPENDRTYVFCVDSKAPSIMGTFSGEIPSPHVEYDKPEDEEDRKVTVTSSFDSLDFDAYEEGDVATLDTLAFEKKEGLNSVSITDGAIIHGTRILISFSDASGLRKDSVTVTRNGQPIKIESENIEETGLALSGYGLYVITAVDNLGNTATFTFNNLEGDIASGYIDGDQLAENTLRYGSESLEVVAHFDGTTTMWVKSNGVSHTYEFHNDAGVVTYGQYYIFREKAKTGQPEDSGTKYAEYVANAKFSLNRDDTLVKRNTWYDAVEESYLEEDPETGKKIEKREFLIQVMFDDDGYVHYRVLPLENEIQAEISFSASALHLPARYQAALSKEIPSIVILSGDKAVEKVASLDYIYVSDTITIQKEAIPATITRIEYCYNKDEASFGKSTVIFDKGAWIEGQDLVGEANGYYQIIVTNQYNNETIYIIDKIDAFESIVTIQCQDGSKVTFHKNEGTIHSNYAIEVMVMTTEVKFEVEVGGKTTTRYGQTEGNSTTITIKDVGQSKVTIIGGNGIKEVFHFDIQPDQTFVFDEDWITGYNEKALRRDEGYTNTACTIVVDEEEVAYIDMVYSGDPESLIKLYDNVTDNKFDDPEFLQGAIGRYGAGEYVIGFRNKYGDLVKKTVYFNDVPSLVLSRTTTSDPSTFQVYDMDLAIEKGFYSNNLLRFSTSSTHYVFTVSGVEYKLEEPKDIEFTNSSGKGSFRYPVTYLDEYGNYVEFSAILYRDDVAFDASGVKIITVGSVDYTKGDVYITFEGDLKATVSVDGGPQADYVSGTKRFADGEYVFVVRDIAGNKSSFTVVHKSTTHYSLTNTESGADIIPGGVINNGTVTFYSNDGSSKIKYVVRDDELVADYATSTFTKTGHYQVLIEDNIGNQSYEEFTILNNSLSTFSYDAPYDYEVTEVWYSDKDGTKKLLPDIHGPSIRNLNQDGDYLIVVSSAKTTSSFNFSVTIDNTLPSAVLVGVSNGEVTARDVTLSGLKVGDVVKIYKDGELVSTTTVTLSTSAPTITTGGRYRVLVSNLQGRTIEYEFTRKAVTNVAGSIFFIIASFLVVTGVSVGLVFHTKLKTDD